MEFINELVILFLLSIGVIIVCGKLRLPATVGFLITGMLCGPSVLGVVSDKHAVDMLAEIGVALLLFTIGMELSGEALARLRKPVFVGGTLQIGVAVAVIAGLAAMLGCSLPMGISFGYLAALSSSAIVLSDLQRTGQTNTPHGRLILAILVLQDIMFAPMLVSIPLLAGSVGLTLESALEAALRITGVFGGVLLFAKYGLSRLMLAVVRTRLRELVLLTTLGLCMGMSMLTYTLGLSLSFGAFLAGLMLARSEYSMNVIAGVLPYRDVFMSLFFISIGMLLDVNFLLENFAFVTFSTCIFIVIKALLVLPAVYFQGYPWRTAILTALPLAQIGEFSFVLAAEEMKDAILEPEQYQLFLAVSILSMMLTPGLIAVGPRLADLVGKLQKKQRSTAVDAELDDDEAGQHLANHLLIVGFGVSGKHLARAAKGAGIDYVILEMNPDTVRRYKGQEHIFYGDASQASVLEHLNVGAARVMAIVISDPAAVRAATLAARGLNPNLHIIARTRFLAEVGPLQNLGANEVIAEEFESSLEIFSRVLGNYLVPRQDIANFVAHIRTENYDMTRKLALQSAPLEVLVDRLPDVGVQAVRLEEGSELAGKSLAECALRRKHGVTVVAIRRGDSMIASPDAAALLEPGDVAYLLGEEGRLHLAEALFGPAVSLPPPSVEDALQEVFRRR
ncbi:MAG: cation:proton antiporter [Betaproteobacteria bacterium]|nr:cation:proton antiporter [Betaproteobacteria bacterium]